MSVRRIRVFGDPVLRSKAEPVADFGTDLDRLVTDLSETLVDAGGAGLAAPQIGVGLRVFVFVNPCSSSGEASVEHLVNPVLVEQSTEVVEDVEGCLSIPGVEYDLKRPFRIVAEGYDRHGEPARVEGTERLARCLAHEKDHLDGVLFVDRLEPELRRRALAEIREMAEAGEDVRVKHSPHAGLA
ncbi:MAG: peptide deformylase [Acidimicrobiales bacterium]